MSGIVYNNKLYPFLTGEQKLLLDGTEAKDGQVITYAEKIVDVNSSQEILNKYWSDYGYPVYYKVRNGEVVCIYLINSVNAGTGVSYLGVITDTGGSAPYIYMTPEFKAIAPEEFSVFENYKWLYYLDGTAFTTKEILDMYPLDLTNAEPMPPLSDLDESELEGDHTFVDFDALNDIFIKEKKVGWGNASASDGSGDGKHKFITQEEYDNLISTNTLDSDTIYFINDGGINTSYSNVWSGTVEDFNIADSSGAFDNGALINLTDDLDSEIALCDDRYFDFTDDGLLTLTDNAKICNPNILDNWWFGNPVNQRGATTESGVSKYTIDRWLINVDAVSWYNINPNGWITLEKGANATQSALLMQRMEHNLLGQTVTFSAAINGKNFIHTFRNISGDGEVARFDANGTEITNATTSSVYLQITKSNNYWSAVIGIPMENKSVVNLNIYSAKIEFGELSTLANESYLNYTLELLKCQRYFISFPAGRFPASYSESNQNQVHITVFLPTKMRANPVFGRIDTATDFVVICGGGAYAADYSGGYGLEKRDLSFITRSAIPALQAASIYSSGFTLSADL